jgi:hypothetical protein
MVHGRNRSDVIEQVESIVEQCGLQQYDHQILFSGRCFKQRGGYYSPAQVPLDNSVSQARMLAHG